MTDYHVIQLLRIEDKYGQALRHHVVEVCDSRDAALKAAEQWKTKEPAAVSYTVQPAYATDHDKRVLGSKW
jgi:hypothetical protein